MELIDKPGSSFVWAPRIDFSDPNLRIFIENNVVQQGLPVLVTNVSKGMIHQVGVMSTASPFAWLLLCA